MKRITLLLATFMVGSVAFAQSTIKELTGLESNPTIFSTGINNAEDDCTQAVESNNLENGGLFAAQRLAVDIDVPAGETFSIETVIPVMIGEGTTYDIIIWNSVGDLPGGVEVASAMEVDVEATELTGSNFGLNFYAVTMIPSTPIVLEGGTDGAKYWMEIVTDANGWESTSILEVGVPGAFNNDSTQGDWAIGSAPTDYVYELIGQCDVLGVDNNSLAQVSVYPNPSSDVFNISLPSNVEVKSSSLVDILGKTTGVVYNNGQMNVSSLAPGVYFMNLETNLGSYNQKVVVKQ